MKVFDTNNNRDKAWSGAGFIIRDNNLILHQSASAKHPVILERGKYILKALLRKRSGNGLVGLGVSNSKEAVIFKKMLDITKTGWVEVIFEFEVDNDNSRHSFFLNRNQNSFGSVEIGRVLIEKTSKVVIPNKLRDYPNVEVILPKAQDNAPPFFNKLAFIVPYKIYGGAEIYIKNLIENLDLNSYRITILYLNKNDLNSQLNKDGVTHQQVPTIKHLEANIIANDYDTIVYYNSHSVYQSLTSLVKRKLISTNIVEIYHSDFSWTDAIANHKKRELVDKIFVVGDSLGNDIEGLLPNSRIVLPVGIDLARFNKKIDTDVRGQLGISFDDKIIGSVARLSKEKNLNYLLELATKMPDFHFVIIGDGPERSNLEQIIKSENLKVQLVGFKRNVEDYLSNFDAFVLPSKMEGTPITICEAMAAEVPVFTNNVGAISDLIKDRETGFFLSGDVNLDAQLIKNEIKNYDVIFSAKQYVTQNHDIRKIVDRFTSSIVQVNNYYQAVDENNGFLKINGEYV